MKKILVLSVLASLTTITSAQVRYDVNVYTNRLPVVEYTSPMGGEYQRMMQMYQEADRNAIERQRLQLEREQMERREWMEIERMAAAARAEGNKIVSDEIRTFNAINLATMATTLIKARVIKKNNGNISMSCLGIKVGETWKPCENSIFLLQELYKQATSEDERSMVLELMDLGNYLLDTDTEMYIMK